MLLAAAVGCEAQVDGGFVNAPHEQDEEDGKRDAAPGDGDDDQDDVPPGGEVPDEELLPDEPAPDTEREPNDDAAAATNVGVPAFVVNGELTAGDRDFYLVRIVQHGGYLFETSTGDADDDQATDTRLEVFRAEAPDEALVYDDDSGEGYGSRAALMLNPGSFVVLVSGYGGAVTGTYALAVSGPQDLPDAVDPLGGAPAEVIGPAEADETEANDTVDSADCMGLDPTSIGAELEPAGVDHFVFAVGEAGAVTIETAPRLDGGATVDTVLELYAADGVTLLGTDDDGADSPLFSRLTVALPAAGVYVLKARGYSAVSAGSYRAFFVR